MREREGAVLTLDGGHFREARPSAFVHDGTKPTFRVRTALGREVEVTATHPFLTPEGWRPLASLRPGHFVAVPARLPVFVRVTLNSS